ncbi:MAG: hypothetical protein H6656_00950 [Ardenticatenaceae bacterium]|nr:hypothetical protein [Ardenticatenaceae bacterium]
MGETNLKDGANVKPRPGCGLGVGACMRSRAAYFTNVTRKFSRSLVGKRPFPPQVKKGSRPLPT